MAHLTNDDDLIFQLLNMVDELIFTLDQLGEDTKQSYKSVQKVKNILKSKDPKGMKNVKQHLLMDFRVIEDRQLEGETLDDVLERIYYHVSNYGIFNH
ncbi:hypothetical protein [Agarivorans gilvus]|uniref:Uncharacterized protein n=1 Tax=Agarivorans gilvus TaxID=680279 RepID=A0ABQ1I783_9ALTE|nr:hypothetical protein [Agarivorans gilvus]GGB22159.1 hypothetical protein GCM10007414_39430 [Agarivorans gilvus]